MLVIERNTTNVFNDLETVIFIDIFINKNKHNLFQIFSSKICISFSIIDSLL